ncbi:MAG: FtsH protease activity modulator HflK [Bryobacterales bacterium]|nr:FtsH protease activity modulator HflK [Bryobacterales bacterium]
MHVVSEDHAINQDARARVKYFGFTAAVGVLLLLNFLGIFKTIGGIDTALFLTLIAGYKTFYKAISDLLERKISADLAIVIAAFAATLVGEYLAAAEAMFIMLVGEGLEAWAAGRTEAAIHRFVDQLPRHATAIRDGREVHVHVEDLIPGDMILVRAGERIAADGVVASGESSVDESPITGESAPRDKGEGDEVFSGTLNGHGLLRVRVTNAAEESTLARLIQLVEEARDHRAPVVRLADKYAQFFLPAILLIAGATYYFSETDGVMRAVAVLIVACPCALILATPAAMVAGIGGLARRGILVRGGAALQTGSAIDTVVFDKTGTLTTGKFRVLKILPAEGFTEADVLALGAAAEAGSDHPLAKVIVEEAREHELDIREAEHARIVPGRGAECELDGRTIRAGNEAFLRDNGVEGIQHYLEEADRAGATPILIARDRQLVGALLLRDTLREGAHAAIHELEDLGISSIVLLTGDRRKAADAIAREAGIQHVEAELLPEQKLDRIKQLQLQGKKVAMIGDGVNDAPALAAADVGVAIAGSGADIAAEAADVVDLNATVEKLPRLFEVSRDTVAVIWQNIILFAGLVNAVSVYFASTGKLGPVAGAAVHQVSSICVMLNSVRLLRVERPKGHRSWGARVASWTGVGRLWRRFVHGLSHLDPAVGFAWIWERRRSLVRPALALAGLWWISTATFMLGPAETGVIERFGRKVLPYRDPGLNWKLPWPIDTVQRVESKKVRTVEIGFRTETGDNAISEPPAYEWNVQHRGGRIRSVDEEALMLTGDQNMIELTAVVHYELDRPDDYLFRHVAPEETIRVAAESALRSIVNSMALDPILTTDRRTLEEKVLQELQQRLERYETGAKALAVSVQDLHPSVEVVDAFREVASAQEEKNRVVNEAEGYRNEQVALARGRAEAQIETAEGYKEGRVNRAGGDASRFTQFEAEYRRAPGPHATRLYLETMEQILPGRRKLILDSKGGKRTLYTIEDGVMLAPAGAQMQQPPPAFRPEEPGEE